MASLGVFALLRLHWTLCAVLQGVVVTAGRCEASVGLPEFGRTVAASMTLPLFCREL
jgi:hypothetical protein